MSNTKRNTIAGVLLASFACIGIVSLAPEDTPPPTGDAPRDHCLAAVVGELPTGVAYWTTQGKPRVNALEDLVGRDITMMDRDRAWTAWQSDAGGERAGCLEMAIGNLAPGDPAHWTKAGLPRVKALEALTGLDISAAERDAAWSAHPTR